MTRIAHSLLLLASLSAVPHTHAQTAASTASSSTSSTKETPASPKNTEPKRPVELRFVIKEVEGGKVINTREYKTRTVANGPSYEHPQIRTGSKVPVETGSAIEVTGKTTRQVQYLDVGVSFDAGFVSAVGDHVSMQLTADISSYVDSQVQQQPVIRQNRWNGTVDVLLSKPTVVFSSDDVLSRRTYEVELTVTPIQ